MVDKKTWLGILVLVFGIAVVEINAQSTNYEPKLVGTWTNVQNGATVVFNSDGTGSWDGINFIRYGAVRGKLIIIYNETFAHAIDYVFSDDGKTLLLSQTHESGITSGWILQKRG